MGRIRRAEREEITTWGPSDFKQLQGGDFYRTPTDVGIRIPTLPVMYRLVLLSFVLLPGDRLVGLRQLLKIGQIMTSGDAGSHALYPETRDVVTTGWTFLDSFNCWTITMEPYVDAERRRGPLDMPGFLFEADSPCLTYETATLNKPPTLPWYLDLLTYKPPGMRGQTIQVLREVRYPWRKSEFWALNIETEIPVRIYVYLDLKQSNPETRPALAPALNPAAPAQAWPVAALDPEELFIQPQLYPNAVYFSAAAAASIERRSTV